MSGHAKSPDPGWRGGRHACRAMPGSTAQPTQVNWSAALVAEVPLGVTTVTSTVPLPGGLVAVISVPELPVITALTSPKSTAVASVKPLPVMVTLSPPAAVPVTGEIAVTCGRAEAGGVVLGSTGPGIPKVDGGVAGASAGPDMPKPGGVVRAGSIAGASASPTHSLSHLPPDRNCP